MVDVFAKNPKAKLEEATCHWIHNSCKQFDYIFDNINKIKTPFILFSAVNEQVNLLAHQNFIDEVKKIGKTAKPIK